MTKPTEKWVQIDSKLINLEDVKFIAQSLDKLSLYIYYKKDEKPVHLQAENKLQVRKMFDILATSLGVSGVN